MIKARVYTTLKQGVLDPQGKAVQHSLVVLGFNQVQDIRIGKYIEVVLNTDDRQLAQKQLKEMCEKLLANTVIESYRFDLE